MARPAPRRVRSRRTPPTAASAAGLRRALAELYGDPPALCEGEAMALREQLRIDAAGQAQRQRELGLAPKGRE